jgi:hypothetical protein
MKLYKFIYAAIGALTGVLICALFSVNFSAAESANSSVKVESTPSASSGSSDSSDPYLQQRNFENLYYQSAQEVRNLQSQLAFCRSDLGMAKLQDFQNRTNNLRNSGR